MTLKIPIILLLSAIFALPITLNAQDSKSRTKEKKKYWQSAIKRSKSIDHKKVQATYPENGWLSGLWCKEGESEPYRFIEVKGNADISVITRGYTATADKVVHKPDKFLYSGVEFLDKPVMVGNESHYDLWYYPEGTGATMSRYVYVERISKISQDKYKVVYRGSYTVNRNTFVPEKFMQKQSEKISSVKHYKEPKVYIRCK